MQPIEICPIPVTALSKTKLFKALQSATPEIRVHELIRATERRNVLPIGWSELPDVNSEHDLTDMAIDDEFNTTSGLQALLNNIAEYLQERVDAVYT